MEGIREKLHKRHLLDSEIATYIIEDPHCLDGDTQKEEAYRIALDYFNEKQKKSESSGKDSPNTASAIQLQVLIDCYEEQKGGSEETECARKIAQHVLQINKYFMRFIPDETKDTAFQIIKNYLEEQMGS